MNRCASMRNHDDSPHWTGTMFSISKALGKVVKSFYQKPQGVHADAFSPKRDDDG